MKNWVFFIVTIIVVFGLGWLISNITDRKAEAKFAYKPKVEIRTDKIEPRDSIWGLNYPRQYQSYMKTADTTYRSPFRSSGHLDALEHEPDLVILWAGYAFSKDYNQPRGHAYAIQDLRKTLRTASPKFDGDGPMPSACWECKGPDVPRMMQELGLPEYYSKKWSDLGSEMVNSIGCADCHDPKTMNLTITRPALVEAFKVQGFDINKQSHQEMRNLVCAQCHVEYYFDKNKVEGSMFVVFPWHNGMTMEGAEEYYDKIGFYDWVHPLSKAKMLKAQHPDYEIYKTSVHAKRGVSCADCHMPYKSEGGQKFTDHHIGSPLANVENSCFVCHRENANDLIGDVYERQAKVQEGTSQLARQVAIAHIEAKKAWDLGATEAQMAPILANIRKAQWRWDYSVASHGGSFHAPVETQRIVNSGLGYARDARLGLSKVLSKLGFEGEVPLPEFKKEVLQAYIGLDMEKERANKKEFLNTLVPEWIKKAKEREAKMSN
ncbi:Cytochrome c-552 [Capnocytophaga canis]|uniref:nitrite reductase (cytochrome; ammonia-forming) n=1 Tax=Capnocytophaga canis TaxID=1848903 RepID=A0A0B7HYV3_9FLAO|nr:ammonia-forming cytochrome c nitrite reductase [Capnocytophaga canis]CEN44605.1 Cytochrome c-552 [Capnocytophaga canis]CEN50275.1 Cytochrome c-552 [Capnocytophaga canis]